jgi:hypothetical protein
MEAKQRIFDWLEKNPIWLLLIDKEGKDNR